MSLITFVSAKGAPGVSVAVTTLASLWPHDAVVADLDPVGGDVALRHQRLDGAPLDENVGLVSLGAALRGGNATDLGDHLQDTQDGLRVLTGVRSPGQVRGLGTSWQHIAATMQAWDGDVLADGGRYSPGTPILPIIERSSRLIFVARADIEGLAHLRDRLTSLHESMRVGTIADVPVGYVLVGDPGDGRGYSDAEKLLGAAGLSAKPFGIIADDPRTVRSLRTASTKRLRRSMYIRSLVDVAQRLAAATPGRAPQNVQWEV